MSEDELRAVLLKLRATYIAEWPERRAELEAELSRVGTGASGAAKELGRLFHRLAGSGGSYGIDAVTQAARPGEHLADALAAAGAVTPSQVEELRSHILAIAAAFEAAAHDDTPPQF